MPPTAVGKNAAPDSLSRDAASACAIILAGGFGTRIKDLFPDLPKPMIPVAGRPFVDWVIEYLKTQGLRRFVVSIGHLAEVMERHFAARPFADSDVRTVRETTPLGTGGAIAFAATAGEGAGRYPERPASWLVVNGDSLVLADLSPVWKPWHAGRLGRGVIVGVNVPDASRFGTLDVATDERLRGFREKQPGRGVINAGIYLLADEIVARFPPRRPLSIERDVFPEFLATGVDLRVHVCDAPFLDIGTPESVREADGFIRSHFPVETHA